tara:strand:+ start:566 stop:1390 length:825 start_codon:yes stop_codon:yes gene_type:complete
MEFNRKFDLREDPDLVEGMSHRLHWDEHPAVWRLRDADLGLEERIALTIHWSFSNEKWTNFLTILEKGWDALDDLFEEERVARNDLFQVYYPKGTKVRQWLTEMPRLIAKEMVSAFTGLNRPMTMMEYAKIQEKVLKDKFGFRSALYPSKNTARYLAMPRPDLVDPESVLIGGTGHFRGMMYVFGPPNIDGKLKYKIGSTGEFIPDNKHTAVWLDYMERVSNWEGDPIIRQKLLNHEDQFCWFSKFVERKHGHKPPAKKFPRVWMFPDDFSLKA